jgi:ribosomal protein S18 acetylase RimI-like enzyme
MTWSKGQDMVELREFIAADREPAIEAIVRSTLFTAEDAEFLRGVFDGHLEAGSESRCIVATVDGHVMGVVYARPEEATDRVWDLTMIGVRASEQGSGIGTALMRRVEHDLAGDGQRLVLVRTSGVERFAATRAFYGRLGYDEVARIPEYWSLGDDLVVFLRALS